MQPWHRGRLTDRQAEFVARWFPDPCLSKDMSWNLVDTVGLDVESENGRVVVKAAASPLDGNGEWL